MVSPVLARGTPGPPKQRFALRPEVVQHRGNQRKPHLWLPLALNWGLPAASSPCGCTLLLNLFFAVVLYVQGNREYRVWMQLVFDLGNYRQSVHI